ncbi:diphthamide synthesis protein [Candidatus Woesearchaeota archaeon]|nr:diphthamide synthesis protein [Candidatus Woesearchaeota archaeon]
MKYDLEIDNVVEQIKKNKAKLVCLQLPDGLKPEASALVKELQKKVDCEFVVWAGSCWGACDTPVGLKELNFDLVVQFGHSAWPFY